MDELDEMEDAEKKAPVEEIAYIVYDVRRGQARKLKNKTMAQQYVNAATLQPGWYLSVTEFEWDIVKQDIPNIEVEVPHIFNVKEL